MTCEPTIIDCRIQGALYPDTRVTFTEDDVAIDPAPYTWTVQGSPSSSRTQAWLKNTGISVVGTEIVIAWAALDLGACTPGEWVLELTGLLGGKPRKAQMLIEIDPEVV